MKLAVKIALFMLYTAGITWLAANEWIYFVVGVCGGLILLFIIWRIWLKHHRKKQENRKIDDIHEWISDQKESSHSDKK